MYTETISNAASELHKSLTPQKPSSAPPAEKQAETVPPPTPPTSSSSPSSPAASQTPEPPRRISGAEVQTHTYTTVRRSRGAARLYWQDTDSQGESAFSLRVLYFIAEEASMAAGNCDESIFLEQLELWPQQLKGDA